MNILKNKYSLIALILFFLIIKSNSQITITGKASSYSGDSLFLYTLNDKITETPKLIATTLVDAYGEFIFNFDCSKPQKVYIDLATIVAFQYVEPNKNYEIRIPAKQELTTYQKLNPFFKKKEVPIFIFIKDKTDLNYLINRYKKTLSNYNFVFKLKNKNEKLIYLDTLKNISDTLGAIENNQYFEDYKLYNYALLRYFLIQGNTDYYLNSFFLQTSVLENNPLYNKLFVLIFENYFNKENEYIDLRNIYKAIEDTNFFEIKKQISEGYTDTIFSELAELIAVKALKDFFYVYPQAQNQIIEIFNKLEPKDISADAYISAKHFLQKVIKIRKGYNVPKFSLKNENGRKKGIEDFGNNFIYLNFVSPESYGCLQQFPLLQNINEKNLRDLKIVTVFVSEDYSDMTDFLLLKKDYKWTFLFADFDSPVLKNFNIENYPTYFLLNPDGTLALENTPTPFDEFEQTYYDVYKKWIIDKKNNRVR